MRWLILGVLLGLLLLFPQALTVAGAVVAAVLSQPVIVAFAIGLAARPHLNRARWWAR